MLLGNHRPLTVIVPLEYRSMMGGMLQSVELTIKASAPHVKFIVVVPIESEVSRAMQAAGAQIVETKGLDEWIVAKTRPLEALRTFRIVRRVIRSLLGERTVLWTNHILTEVLCGLGNPFPSHPRVFTSRGSLYAGFSKKMLALSLKHVSMCTGLTIHQKEVLVDGLNFQQEAFRVIPDSVEPEFFMNLEDEERPQWYKHGAVHIGVAGFPSRLKNQELLIRAIAVLKSEFPNIRGVIAGSPGCDENRSYLRYLQSLGEEMDVSDLVSFVPFDSNKRRLFAGFDIVVSTSLSEGFGLSIIQAMAASRPVVALRCGGPEFIIDHGRNGLVVDHNSPSELADCIASLLKNPETCRRLVSQALLDVSSRFDAGRVSRHYAEIFGEVLETESIP
jgi:glycosyltransferase involved in cell wall biosynthesis